MLLFPERRLFHASQVTETMVAVQSSPLRDLYVVYAGRSPEDGKPVIHAYLLPLIKWIWFGGIVVVLGTVLAITTESPHGPGPAPRHGKILGRRHRRSHPGTRRSSPQSGRPRLIVKYSHHERMPQNSPRQLCGPSLRPLR